MIGLQNMTLTPMIAALYYILVPFSLGLVEILYYAAYLNGAEPICPWHRTKELVSDPAAAQRRSIMS